MSLGTIFVVFWNLFCPRYFFCSGLRSVLSKAISSSVHQQDDTVLECQVLLNSLV